MQFYLVAIGGFIILVLTLALIIRKKGTAARRKKGLRPIDEESVRSRKSPRTRIW